VLAVVVVLHEFVFQNLINDQSTDILAFWYPSYCMMGKGLAAGHILSWNPSVMGGIPFAADPQTGWTYLPVMLLFGLLPCDLAMRLYTVLLPILAGLGLYWFLRTEGLSRPAAGAAGLVVALVLSGSLLVSLPFTAIFAWSMLMLAAAARYLRASTWSGRLVWAALAALAWGQMAAGFMSDGIMLGTALLVVYLVAKVTLDAGQGRRLRVAVALPLLLLVCLPLVNLAFLLPRLSYLPRTTLGIGYRRLQILGDTLARRPPRTALLSAALRPTWPLGFTVSPGSYVGAAALGVTFAAWRSRRLLALAAPFALFGLVSYLLTLRPSIRFAASHFGTMRLTDFYLHDPTAFRYGVLLALPILVGLGVQALLDAPNARAMGLLLMPGILVFWVLPFLFHIPAVASSTFLLAMLATAVAVIILADRRTLLAGTLAGIVGVELVASCLVGQSRNQVVAPPDTVAATVTGFAPLGAPLLSASGYLEPTKLAATLQKYGNARYLSYLTGVLPQLGYLKLQTPDWWGLLANQRSVLFGIEDIQGYNPVQLTRFWEFNRTSTPGVRYNHAFFHPPRAVVVDLLQVGWIVAPADAPPSFPAAHGAVRVAVDGQWGLYRIPQIASRASVVTSWEVQRDPEKVRQAIFNPFFSPEAKVLLERDPGIAGTLGAVGKPTAVYRSNGPQAATVEVTTPASGIVLVRNTYDPSWHATVDGKAAPILQADYIVQGIAVGPGHHVVRLTYDDPTIGHGLLGSVVVLLLMFGTAFAVSPRSGRLRGYLAKIQAPAPVRERRLEPTPRVEPGPEPEPEPEPAAELEAKPAATQT
jgi:hypothetical protein